MRICDILKNEYSEFLEYCAMAGKEIVGDITSTDYIAYRTQFGVSRDDVAALRRVIETFDPCTISAAEIKKDEAEIDGIMPATPDDNSAETLVSTADQTCLEVPMIGEYEDGDSPEIDCSNDETECAPSFAELHSVEAEDYRNVEIEALLMSNRAYNALRRLGCSSLADLLGYSTEKLAFVRNIGKGSIEEIAQKISEYLSGKTSQKLSGSARYNIDIEADLDKKLADIFNEDNQTNTDAICLSELDLSARSSNALNAVNCTMLNDLLSLTVKDLWELPCVGRTSVENIISALSEFFLTPSATDEEAENVESVSGVQDKCKLRAQVERMLAGFEYDEQILDTNDIARFRECRAASEILGAEFCMDAMNAVPAVQQILYAAEHFQWKNTAIRRIDSCIRKLEANAQEHVVYYYWLAYRKSVLRRYTSEHITTQVVGEEVSAILGDQMLQLKDLAKAIDEAISEPTQIRACIEFAEWTAMDLALVADQTVDYCFDQKNGRYVEVLYQRALGKTLEELGIQENVTRERVRQMETKALRLFMAAVARSKCEVILTTSALLGGLPVLKKDDFAKVLSNKNTELLWYALEKGEMNCDEYHFDANIGSVVIGNTRPLCDIEEVLKQLPEGMFIDEAEAIIEELAGCDLHFKELLRIEIERRYKKHGKYLHRSRLTVLEICDYILKHRFPNGYKIADADYEEQFRRHMQDLFGKVNGLPSGHSIDAKICDVGMLYDRGRYIHPSAINLEPDAVERINKYIADSPRTVLTFAEIFDALKESFDGTSITNKYIMQGMLNRLGSPFILRRDYVTKEPSFNVAEEITSFIESRGRVHKSEIEEEFAIDDHRLAQVLARCTDVVCLDAGYYVHADELIVTRDGVTKMRQYLKTTCADTPVSARAMLDDFNLQFTDFVLDNGIDTHGSLFGVLQYLFREEFYFSRPFISMKKVGSMTNRSVLLSHLNNIETIDADDLADICNSIGIRFITYNHMFTIAQPEYVRIDEDTLMRSDLAGVTAEVVDCLIETIKNDLEIYRYRPTNKIVDFSWYPEINTEWNPFLVESIAALSEDNIPYVKIPMGVSTLPAMIFLSEEYADDDYTTFVVKLLTEEHQRDPFSSAAQVLSWLIENGLCFKKLPSFLEEGHHLYTDENGVFRVE